VARDATVSATNAARALMRYRARYGATASSGRSRSPRADLSSFGAAEISFCALLGELDAAAIGCAHLPKTPNLAIARNSPGLRGL
jgi:hypothetical protein